MKQYVCGICGYIHDEAVGDPTMELHPTQNGKTFPRILSASVQRRKRSILF